MAAGATYEPIATTTLSSAASSITFSSIPSTYTDLRVILTEISNSASYDLFSKIQFNNDAATNYSLTRLYGNGTSAVSDRQNNAAQILLQNNSGATNTKPALCTVDIFNYAGSTYKTSLVASYTDLNGSGAIENLVGLWRSTSAITSLKLSVSDFYGIGTTATLYGIKAA